MDEMVTINGTSYKIVHDASLTNYQDRAIYEAVAINTADIPDEYNTVPAWSLLYEIPDNIDPDTSDPSVEIDWNAPDEILPHGGTENQDRYKLDDKGIVMDPARSNKEPRTNAGYTITSSIAFGNTEVVLGEHETAYGKQFVTWEYSDRNNYYWGHYFSDEIEAKADLIDRAQQKIRQQQMIRSNEQQHGGMLSVQELSQQAIDNLKRAMLDDPEGSEILGDGIHTAEDIPDEYVYSHYSDTLFSPGDLQDLEAGMETPGRKYVVEVSRTQHGTVTVHAANWDEAQEEAEKAVNRGEIADWYDYEDGLEYTDATDFYLDDDIETKDQKTDYVKAYAELYAKEYPSTAEQVPSDDLDR